MEYVVSREEMQSIDAYTIQEIGIPSMVLMERAAYCVANTIIERVATGTILVVAENGNNGADGVAIARMLLLKGYRVVLVCLRQLAKTTEEFERQLAIYKKLIVKNEMGSLYESIPYGLGDSYRVVVDAIFGVGLTRAVTGVHEETITWMNQLSGWKVAVDQPTGLDATTGQILGCVFQADITITFGYRKRGQLLGFGESVCGDVQVADIGFPEIAAKKIGPKLYMYTNTADAVLPERSTTANKGTYGKVVVFAGSEEISGAAYFCSEAAYRMGCGLVKVVTHRNNRQTLQTLLPEAMIVCYETEEELRIKGMEALQWGTVVVAGPGIGTGSLGECILKMVLLQQSACVVLDADGVTLLGKHKEYLKNRTCKELIITPHIKEFADFAQVKIGDMKEKLLENALLCSEAYDMTVVAKDHHTIVASHKQMAYINSSGNDGMATGGSGDVLAGMIGGLLAQGMKADEAAVNAVYLHGVAGDEAKARYGARGMLASDIIKQIPKVLTKEDLV